MESLAAFQADIETAPLWVQYWVQFIGLTPILAIPFAFARVEARWALLVMALTLPAMVMLHSVVGFVRLLGLVHVVIWTASLAFDYDDVARRLFGERAPI